MRIPSSLIVLALATASSALACEDKKPASESTHTDGGTGTDKYASADPKLEKAIQAAASASAEAASAPPQTGIFETAVADQKHPKGAPTKVDLASDGADPKISLGSTADASADAARSSSYGPAALELAMVLMQGSQRVALPTLDLGMVIAPGKKDEGGADWMVATVARSTPAKQQLGQLPPGMDKDIAGLQSSQFRMKLTPDGRESESLLELSKTAKPELERLAQNAIEALVFATVPTPPKPVGVGAQWIAETRLPLGGVDAIAYRAYHVKSIEGDRVHLTLQVKAYAIGKEAPLAGLPNGSTFEEFDAQSEGELELQRGEILARKSDVQQRVVMVFAGPGGAQAPTQQGQPPGNVMAVQFTSQATLVRGDDLRAAMKQP
jgi:hypothetical protein